MRSDVPNERAGSSEASVPPPPTSRSFWKALGAVAVLKMLMLFVALPLLQHTAPDEYLMNRLDQDNYTAIAWHMLQGDGYRLSGDTDTSETMLRGPGYVLILAGIFAAVGKNLLAVQMFQLVLTLAAGWALYRLALHITGSDKTATIAATIYLLYPATVLAESRATVESTLTASVILFILLFYRSIGTFSYRDFAMTGAVFGWTLLVKGVLALVLPALFVYVVCVRRTRSGVTGVAVRFAVASLAALVVVSPWMIRNYAISGKLIPAMTTIGGLAVWTAVWEEKHRNRGEPDWQLVDDTIPELTRIAQDMGLRVRRASYFLEFYSGRDEVRYYDELGRRARSELMASPRLAARFIAHNLIGFWIEGRTPRATLLNAILVVPFLILVLLGVVISLPTETTVGPLLVVIAAYYLPHLGILAEARYYAPLVPFLAIFAAIAITSVWRRLGSVSLFPGSSTVSASSPL